MTGNHTDELIETGKLLVRELESLANEYHVKSQQHEILLWEASIVNAEVQNLTSGSEILENLRGSKLLSDRGDSLAMTIPEMTGRVKRFHEAFHMARKA